MAVITFSRLYGTGARELGHRLAGKLGYAYIDKELLAMLSKRVGTTPGDLEAFEDEGSDVSKISADLLRTRYPKLISSDIEKEDYIRALTSLIEELANRDNVIIVGRGGQCILANCPVAYHFRLVADLTYRVKILKEVRKLDYGSDEALIKIMQTEDERKKNYMRKNFHVHWDDSSLYHLIINLSKVPVALAEQFILETVKRGLAGKPDEAVLGKSGPA